MAALVSFGATMFQSIFGLYALIKFDFNPQQVGTILVVAGVVSAVMQGFLTGPVTRRWGEPLAIKVFFITNGIGFLVLLLAGSYPTVLLTAGIYTLSHALLRPAVTSLTSKRAEMAQGVAMGLNSSAISLGDCRAHLCRDRLRCQSDTSLSEWRTDHICRLCAQPVLDRTVRHAARDLCP